MANAHYEIAQTRYSLLQQRIEAFCSAFLDLPDDPPEKILTGHFTSSNPRITEHGPAWANKRLPFLGKTFTGKQECLQYFDLLPTTLDFIPNENTFPGSVVDDRASTSDDGHSGVGKGWDGRGAVTVVGKAKFRAVQTSRSWEEQFIYRLSEFDEDGGIGNWEIWADPLSAWVAVGCEGSG